MQGSNNTFLYVHALWCTAGRKPVLSQIVRKVLYAFLKKSPEQKGIQVIEANGAEDHIHCLFKLMPVQSVAKVIHELKMDSTEWLNSNKFLSDPFAWNDGYWAWSVSPSTIDKAVEYISKQEVYHLGKSMDDELDAFNRMIVHIH